MPNYKYFGLMALTLLLVSCGAKEKKAQEIVRHIPSPEGSSNFLPYLFSNSDQAILSWVHTVNDSTTQLKYSYLDNDEWKAPKEIIKGSDWFVNWADFPLIAENKGNLISHILQKSSAGTYSYDIKLNLLPKGDTEWKTGLPLHTDGTKTEHGFVSAIPFKEDQFFMTWLDGRNTGDAAQGHEHEHGHGGAMSIRAAVVSPTGALSEEALVDNRTCDCCGTTAAITSNGPVVLYRDRTEDEIRDISISRYVNGAWTSPKPVHRDGWEIKGCPVNGPKSDAFGNTLVAAWFTAANNEPVVKVAFSEDGGENFDAPFVINDHAAIGRVDVLMIDAENVIASWMESVGDGAQLKAVMMHISGKISTPIVISQIDAPRKAGFPQMELVKDKVYFAWTAVRDQTPQVQTAFVHLDSF
ncbi:hypothetical protein HCG49_08635 [Arenibacter sp. 6A1]|uniref:hypothetical protein n=1 Tax=Arenibacter sp. 6A1 TaxID=2720391 RepID=UPI001448085C|nr:hypothetical protein [Arenibacter sp. 6A1]NKI26627.1 hypothetical protein [Arenibacter sp. 6A1]